MRSSTSVTFIVIVHSLDVIILIVTPTDCTSASKIDLLLVLATSGSCNAVAEMKQIEILETNSTRASAEADAESARSSLYYDAQGHRQGRLLTLMGFTTTSTATDDESSGSGQQPQREIDPFFFEFTLSAYLAWRDIRYRRGEILPHLPALLEGCDMEWTLEVRDTQLSPRVAIQELLKAADPLFQKPNGTSSSSAATTSMATSAGLQPQAPTAIAGCMFSSISQQVATLAGALGIPQISGTSTAMTLEARENSPLFSRTIPTDAQGAHAAMMYYKQLGVTRLATVFVNEPYGTEYNEKMQEQAKQHNVTLLQFPLERSDMEPSMRRLRQSQVKYIFAIPLEGDWQPMALAAHAQGLIGQPDYAWMIPEFPFLLDPSFALDRTLAQDQSMAQAIHGLAMLSLQLESSLGENLDQRFYNALEEFYQDEQLQAEFIAAVPDPEVTVLLSNYSFGDHVPAPFLFHHLIYDSVIAMSLAACDTPGLFTGPQLYQQLLGVELEGISGFISFNNQTGTRSSASAQYRVDNLLLSDNRSTATEFKLDVQTTAMILGDNVTQLHPFVYYNNQTQRPPTLPLILDPPVDYHLIPVWAQIVGWSLSGVVILTSLALIVWTLWNRKKFIVSAAQPIFLCQLCLGTILLATAVFPLSLQDSADNLADDDFDTPHRLDTACMSIPWLLFVGFVTSVSATLSKTWRLNKIMHGSQTMTRVTASAQAAALPFVMLMVWNLAMLIGWTFVSPYQYVRIPLQNVDEFGRPLEYMGGCQCRDKKLAWLFAILMCLANSAGVLFVMVECYKARNLSEYFSEARSLTLSIASLTETTLLGLPIILAVQGESTAFFLVASALMCIVAACFLIPVFAFRVQHSEARYKDARQDTQRRETAKKQAETAKKQADLYAIAVDGSRGSDDQSVSGRMSIRRKMDGSSGHLSINFSYHSNFNQDHSELQPHHYNHPSPANNCARAQLIE